MTILPPYEEEDASTTAYIERMDPMLDFFRQGERRVDYREEEFQEHAKQIREMLAGTSFKERKLVEKQLQDEMHDLK